MMKQRVIPLLKIGTLLVAIGSLLTQGACAPFAIGATSMVGMVGAQERSAGAAVDDTVIWSQIKHYYLDKDVNNLLAKVSVEVTEGRVLLTGTVDSPDMRVEAVRLAWQPRGVKEVINEIQITNTQDIQTYTQDVWITAQVKSKLLLNKEVQSINYSVDTVNKIVYLMGIAKSQRELDVATAIASRIRGVQKVVSHVRLRDSTLRQEPIQGEGYTQDQEQPAQSSYNPIQESEPAPIGQR